MSETRADQIARWELEGWLDPKCPGCRPFYALDCLPVTIHEPLHQASVNCESGKRPHCSCDRCW